MSPAADPRARRRATPLDRRYVFVAGCPRTGTSALALLLNEHPSVAIGFERFKRIRGQIEPFHFEPQVLCNPVATETDILVPGFYEHLRQKFAHGDVAVVGDKVPLFTDSLDHLQETFPGCRIVMTVRELEATAASFNARAIDPQDVWSEANDHRAAAFFWNGALYAAREFEAAGGGDQLLLIPYDELFDGQRLWLEVLLDFLGLPSTPSFTRAYEEGVVAARARARDVARRLPASAREAVLAERDEQLDAWWRQRTELQAKNFRGRLRASADPPAAEPRTTTPIPADVRRELLEALKAAPKAHEELSELERRVGAQMRELAERGRRLSSLEKDLGATRAELDSATRARETMTLEVQELAAQSASTRERLAARLAEAGIELEAQRRAAERAEALERELASSRAERSAHSARVDELAAAIEQLEQVTGERDRARARIKSEAERLDARHGALESELRALGQERDRARARIESETHAAGVLREQLENELKDAYAARSHAIEEAGAQREQLTSANAELQRRLTVRGEELDTAVRQLVALESAVGSLEQMIGEVRAEITELRADRAGLLARVDTLTLHNEGLAEAVTVHERSEIALRSEAIELAGENERRRARVRTLESELNARVAALNARIRAREQTLGELERERERTVDDVRRAAASRAWRWGHAVTRLLRTVTFRRSVHRVGALDALMQRLEAAQLALPAGDSAAPTDEPTGPR